jgi:hypothetical protein
MTKHKHLKQLVRARMAKTGERYSTARRHIVRDAQTATPRSAPGSVPASSALRTLLVASGFVAPHTGEVPSEALVFGLAGGIGAGVFAFLYEREDVATFFIGGRHLWQDDVAWFEGAARRLEVPTEILETGGRKQAQAQLHRALSHGHPVVAWVDKALLPHRGLPAWMAGGGYHVVTVHGVDESEGTVQLGDLGDELVTVPMDTFADARARIGKQRHRLLRLTEAPPRLDLRSAVEYALVACSRGLVEQRLRNFTLDSFGDWAKALGAKTGKEAWATKFAPGRRMFSGLRWAHEFIEHADTGGGLCRPLYAEFLAEVGAALGSERLLRASEAYAALGREWSQLADALLPDDVPVLAEAKRAVESRAELVSSGAPPAAIREAWDVLEVLAERAAVELNDAAPRMAELREELSVRVQQLHAREREALGVIEAGP